MKVIMRLFSDVRFNTYLEIAGYQFGIDTVEFVVLYDSLEKWVKLIGAVLNYLNLIW